MVGHKNRQICDRFEAVDFGWKGFGARGEVAIGYLCVAVANDCFCMGIAFVRSLNKGVVGKKICVERLPMVGGYLITYSLAPLTTHTHRLNTCGRR